MSISLPRRASRIIMTAPNEHRWLSADLFPTKWSFIIFISYMALFINQGILVTATQNEKNQYNYNTITVVLLTECLKLFISSVVYIVNRTSDQSSLCSEMMKFKNVLLLYFVPAFLYCLYNNLTFVNLAAFDPTTYFLLLQFRVVVTGIIFQILFAKKLSGKQWISLVLLTVGCIVKQMNTHSNSAKDGGSVFSLNLVLILLQVFCSCFAGVYNEYLLKDTGAQVPIMLQNIFMYCDSIICNMAVLAFSGQISTAFTSQSLHSLKQFKVLLIMLNSAGIGIVTSLFLKNLNSILKTFASALELMFTAILCWIIFGIAIDLNTIVAIAIVSYATFLYSQNPVVNLGKTTEMKNDQSRMADAKTMQNV